MEVVETVAAVHSVETVETVDRSFVNSDRCPDSVSVWNLTYLGGGAQLCNYVRVRVRAGRLAAGLTARSIAC